MPPLRQRFRATPPRHYDAIAIISLTRRLLRSDAFAITLADATLIISHAAVFSPCRIIFAAMLILFSRFSALPLLRCRCRADIAPFALFFALPICYCRYCFHYAAAIA